eukprot:COSAG06_NODE_789_length_12286_cov_11.884713_3_plen_461_part_00
MAERQLQPWDDVSLLAGTWVAAGTANDEHAVERMLLRVSPTGELSGLVDDGDGEFEESDCKIGNSSAWISSGGYWVAFDQIYSDDGSTTRWEAQYFEDTDTLEGSWTGDCAGFFVAHRLHQMESPDRGVSQPLPADCEPESQPEAELSDAAELARLRSELEAGKSAHTVTETTKRHAAARRRMGPMETAARATPHDLSGSWELQETDGAKGFLKDTRAKWDKKTGRLDAKVLTAVKERAEYTQMGNEVQIRAENLKRGTFSEETFTVDGLKHYGEWTNGARPWVQWSWDEDGWAVQVATTHGGPGGCLRTRVGMLDANTMIKTVQAYNGEQDEPLSQNMLKRTYTRVAPLDALEIPRVLQTVRESIDGKSEDGAQLEYDAAASEPEPEPAAPAGEQTPSQEDEATGRSPPLVPAPRKHGLLRRVSLPLVWIAALLWVWQIVRTKRLRPPSRAIAAAAGAP